jgi:hypothetical protein
MTLLVHLHASRVVGFEVGNKKFLDFVFSNTEPLIHYLNAVLQVLALYTGQVHGDCAARGRKLKGVRN